LRFDGPNKIRFTGQFAEPEQRFDAAQRQLAALAKCAA
jgi:hypothetical protein